MRKVVKYQDYNMIKNLESYQIKKLIEPITDKAIMIIINLYQKMNHYISEIRKILLLA